MVRSVGEPYDDHLFSTDHELEKVKLHTGNHAMPRPLRLVYDDVASSDKGPPLG